MIIDLLRGDIVVYSVMRELIKAYYLGLGVSPKTVSQVYDIEPELVYGYLEQLYRIEVVEKIDNTYKIVEGRVIEAFRSLLELEVEKLGLSVEKRILYLEIPDTMYYIVSLPSEYLGEEPLTALIVDREA